MQGEKGLKQALKKFHHFRELLLTQCGQSEIKWAKKTGNQNLPRQVDSNGCSMFAGDIHGLATANACPETASQSYRRRCGQKEFVGVRRYNKYNIPPFTVTMCCFGVLVTLEEQSYRFVCIC